MDKKNFIKDLYRNAVDGLDADHLSHFLADDVHFSIGNSDMITGKDAVLKANRDFFNSIKSMRHQIYNIWVQNNFIICNGRVDYIRLDGSPHTAVFATVLKLKDDKIKDYLIYVDLSQL